MVFIDFVWTNFVVEQRVRVRENWILGGSCFKITFLRFQKGGGNVIMEGTVRGIFSSHRVDARGSLEQTNIEGYGLFNS